MTVVPTLDTWRTSGDYRGDALNADMGEDAERLWDLKAFTDNLVMGHPVGQDGEPELGQVLMEIAALQLDLARRAELLGLRLDSIQKPEEHWVIADLVGKGGQVRTVPIPMWVRRPWMRGRRRPPSRVDRSFERSIQLSTDCAQL